MHLGSWRRRPEEGNRYLTYGELGAYATTHEISIEGPLREYYLIDANETPDSAEWKTELGWPIFRSDGKL